MEPSSSHKNEARQHGLSRFTVILAGDPQAVRDFPYLAVAGLRELRVNL